MASRNLNDLHPDLKQLARCFVKCCKAEGIDVLIYCTYRSYEEQDKLYAQGRTRAGRIVTYVKGGGSAHNHVDENGKPAALAFDAVPQQTQHGHGHKSLIWNDPMLWKRMGEIAGEIGLKWGGNWKKFKDKPHFYIELQEKN